ncbi:MAG: DNA polymerase I, partial [Muribaculaceae bacterium]|nr:DNA polymerase I [Muribaculaceae bacterium]
MPDDPATPSVPVATYSTEFVSIDPADHLRIGRLIESAVGHHVGICLNAFGSDAMTATLTGIAIAPEGGETAYIPLPATAEAVSSLMALIEPLFTAPDTLIISHELKRDILLLRRHKIDITAQTADTAVAHYLLEPEKRHRLSDLALTLLGHTVSNYAEESRARRLEIEAVSPDIAAEQATLLPALHTRLQQLLTDQSLADLYTQIEMPVVRVLADMEWTGVRIDTAELARLSAEFTTRMEAMEAEVYRLAGTTFNISSPMQVGEVLFERLQIDPKAKRTKRGAYSTTEEILEKYRADHPIVDLILKIRALRKLLTTYVNALPGMINPSTGKIHTTYNQTVTATGRLSSTNPNLQNIPIRTDDGREIRRAF